MQHGDITLLTPYFNPFPTKAVRNIVRSCRERLAFETTVIELSLTGEFELATASHDIRIHGGIRNVLPQRMRLLNAGLAKLQPATPKISWIDPWLIFENADWLQGLSNVLEYTSIAQPFEFGYTPEGDIRAAWSSNRAAGIIGAAWGVRRNILPIDPKTQAPSLPDRQLLGDEYIFASRLVTSKLPAMFAAMDADFVTYCEAISGEKTATPMTVPGAIQALLPVHTVMDLEPTAEFLRLSRYQPRKDLEVDANGLYAWAPIKDRSLVYFFQQAHTKTITQHTIDLSPSRVYDEPPAVVPTTPRVAADPRPSSARDPNKRTIAILTPGLGLGGAEIWIRSLVTNIPTVNWVVCAYVAKDWSPVVVDPMLAAGVEIHSIDAGNPRVFSHATTPDAVQASIENVDAVLCWTQLPCPLKTNAPLIFVGHGICEGTVRAAQQVAGNGAILFVGVSELAAAKLRDVVSPVKVVLNGADTRRLAHGDPQRLRKGWTPGGHPDIRYVGYCGRLDDEKNVESVIFAMTQLPSWYKLVFVGCTGGKRERVLALARTLLAGRLVEVPQTDAMGEVLRALDCLVQVSQREANSLVICEALLCGVPVVSNRTGAIKEMEIRYGGELVRAVPHTPLVGEIAEQIRVACDSDRRDWIKHAQIFAERYLTAATMAENWEKLLEGVIGGTLNGRNTTSSRASD